MARRKRVEVNVDDVDFQELQRYTDPWYFDGRDPNKEYYIAEDKPLKIAQLKRAGYEVSVGPGGTSDFAGNTSPDSAIRFPGMILMETSKENHEKRMKMKQAIDRRNRSHIESIMDAFKRQLKERGISNKYIDAVGISDG